jgi:addiction module HigA family antidote
MERDTPPHPGEVLKSEYPGLLGLSPEEFAVSAGIPPERIQEILGGYRAISADIATRLADRLGTTPEFWLTLQTNYDLALVNLPRPKRPRRRR